jgi:catechol 2,3-dioxygenase
VTHAIDDVLPYGIRPPGYRLPSAAHIGRVRLQVADIERSIRYYETIIGLQVLSREGAVATLGAGGAPLVELHARRGAHSAAHRGHLGLYHFAILLPNREALGRFMIHLADDGVYAGMSDHLVSEALYLTDPDGLGIEVYADRPRDAWRHRDRQLAMSSDPLDTKSLIAAAGAERWSGLPAGTVIGHVHLHVGDLNEAERFYHAGLGFDKVVWQYPGALFLSAGGYHHHLGTNTWAARAQSTSDDDARLIDWEIVVPSESSVDEVAASLERMGYTAACRDGALAARDPWGTSLRVVARR